MFFLSWLSHFDFDLSSELINLPFLFYLNQSFTVNCFIVLQYYMSFKLIRFSRWVSSFSLFVFHSFSLIFSINVNHWWVLGLLLDNQFFKSQSLEFVIQPSISNLLFPWSLPSRWFWFYLYFALFFIISWNLLALHSNWIADIQFLLLFFDDFLWLPWIVFVQYF